MFVKRGEVLLTPTRWAPVALGLPVCRGMRLGASTLFGSDPCRSCAARVLPRSRGLATTVKWTAGKFSAGICCSRRLLSIRSWSESCCLLHLPLAAVPPKNFSPPGFQMQPTWPDRSWLRDIQIVCAELPSASIWTPSHADWQWTGSAKSGTLYHAIYYSGSWYWNTRFLKVTVHVNLCNIQPIYLSRMFSWLTRLDYTWQFLPFELHRLSVLSSFTFWPMNIVSEQHSLMWKQWRCPLDIYRGLPASNNEVTRLDDCKRLLGNAIWMQCTLISNQ